MAKQDRSGSKYETLLACSLKALGYERNVDAIKNYLQPVKNSDVVIQGTYVQPDIVIRKNEIVEAIIYVTHWSNKRDSKRKFWRTWEELAQQRCALKEEFVSINCIFEALPSGSQPLVCRNACDLPVDDARERILPQQLQGWDPGIGWAIVEAFDVSVLFPVGYAPVSAVSATLDSDDATTTELIRQAILTGIKKELCSQWNILRSIKKTAPSVSRQVLDTQSRFRIGLLHLYIVSRVFARQQGAGALQINNLIEALAPDNGQCRIDKVHSVVGDSKSSLNAIHQVFETLSKIYTRSGRKPEMLCNLRQFGTLFFVTLNEDLQKCLLDIKVHPQSNQLLLAMERAFARFDGIYGVVDALDDLNSAELVSQKESYVRNALVGLHSHGKSYADLFTSFSTGESRKEISTHQHNWFFELSLYLMGINSTEDLQKDFQEEFEKSGHKLRPHAPFGDTAATVIYLIQGIDVCCQWGANNRSRTLSAEDFRLLCWSTVGAVLANKCAGKALRCSEEAIAKYQQNKSWRIISSNLNGFYAMVEVELGNLCSLVFDEAETGDLSILRQPSWATTVVSTVWGGRPLETWFEGVSKDGKWLIKVQSAQDGHEADKTKELAGRCRAMHLDWKAGKDIRDRSKWTFTARTMPKCALVLDGDWDRTNKKNLYEAGWDWVGDVSQLEDLRQLIVQSAK